MPFFNFFKKRASKKVTEKVVQKAGQHTQQHIQTHTADYSDRLGSRAEGYANRYERTREHAPQIREVTTRGAVVGLGVAGQYAADRQTSQYKASNGNNNMRTGPPQGPKSSPWERTPRARPSQPAYSNGGGLSAPRAVGTTRMQTGNRTGGRNSAPSSEDTWYESSNIRIGAGEGGNLVEYVQKDPARARRLNR